MPIALALAFLNEIFQRKSCFYLADNFSVFSSSDDTLLKESCFFLANFLLANFLFFLDELLCDFFSSEDVVKW